MALNFIDLVYHRLEYLLLLFSGLLPFFQISIPLTIEFIDPHHLLHDFIDLLGPNSQTLLLLPASSIKRVLPLSLMQQRLPVDLLPVKLVLGNFSVEIEVLRGVLLVFDALGLCLVNHIGVHKQV